MDRRLVSDRFPYIPIIVNLPRRSLSVEALLDTGFECDVIVPESFIAIAGSPASRIRLQVADGATVIRPVFFGTVDIDPFGRVSVEIAALGDECLIGRGIADRFGIFLDHRRRVVIEP